MSPRLTYKNIAILGLVQIGVIVFGVLGAGATFKMWSTFGTKQSSATEFAVEYGFLVLIVPLAWITTAMVVQHRNEEDDPEALTFMSGAVVLLLLIVAVLAAAVTPWFRLWSCSLSLSN